MYEKVDKWLVSLSVSQSVNKIFDGFTSHIQRTKMVEYQPEEVGSY